MSKKRFKAQRAEREAEASPPPPTTQLHTPVALSYRFAEPGGDYCLSRCTLDEVREVIDCLRQLTTLSWQQVLETGGTRSKSGLGCTNYPDSALVGVTRPSALGPEATIVGIRASQRFRIFGVYLRHLFYLLWFDRLHQIVPG